MYLTPGASKSRHFYFNSAFYYKHHSKQLENVCAVSDETYERKPDKMKEESEGHRKQLNPNYECLFLVLINSCYENL